MNFHVYILKSLKNGKYYIGQTQNLNLRLSKHNAAKVKSTKPHLPWNLVWSELHESRKSAVNKYSQQ